MAAAGGAAFVGRVVVDVNGNAVRAGGDIARIALPVTEVVFTFADADAVSGSAGSGTASGVNSGEVGDTVVVRASFPSNNEGEEDTVVAEGTTGTGAGLAMNGGHHPNPSTVERVDDDGDVRIIFQGMRMKQWVFRDQFARLAVTARKATTASVSRSANTGAALLSAAGARPLAGLELGDTVVVRDAFPSNNDGEDSVVAAGMVGTVDRIDDDGDARIEFVEMEMKQWVFRPQFGKLEVTARVGYPPTEPPVAPPQEPSDAEVEDAVRLLLETGDWSEGVSTKVLRRSLEERYSVPFDHRKDLIKDVVRR
eukprot:gene4136-47323_t